MKLYKGRVLESFGSYFTVVYRGALISCALRGNLRKNLKAMHTPIAVGDFVSFGNTEEGMGIIEELIERKTKISRPSRVGALKEKVIVSNVDQIVAMVSAKSPELKTGLIDRMMLVAERENLKGIICINKCDLINEGELDEIAEVYRKMRYKVLLISALNSVSVEDLRALLKNKFSVFLGQSGVGKTTLLNALQPDLNRLVQSVSASNQKGKHTTSHVSAVYCDFGGMIADSPGFRNFGLWGIEKGDVGSLYRDFRKFVEGCKYNPCSHTHEPHCGVSDAVSAGKIADFRYDNYCRIMESFHEDVTAFNPRKTIR